MKSRQKHFSSFVIVLLFVLKAVTFFKTNEIKIISKKVERERERRKKERNRDRERDGQMDRERARERKDAKKRSLCFDLEM